MFGYVKIFRPELKMIEYEQYKAVYCSLCRALGRRYGLAARMTLSYDFTFLALFLMACKDQSFDFEQGRCLFHPLKKRAFCVSNPIVDYTADVAMLLVYHKLSDTICDERFGKRVSAHFLKAMYRRDFRRAVKRCPCEAQAAQAFMQAQNAVEVSEKPCIDACAEPTAMFLSTLVSQWCDAGQVDLAARFGYCLGRFIYLADAAQDMQEDLKKHRFNPFLLMADNVDEEWITSQKNYAAQVLHESVAVCAECLEDLQLYRFQGILWNVICKGLPHVIEQICKEGTVHDEKPV